MKKVLSVILLTALLLCGCRFSRQEVCLSGLGPLEKPLTQVLEQAGYSVTCEAPVPETRYDLVLTREDLVFTADAPSPALLPLAWDLNGDGRLACVLVTDGQNSDFPQVLRCTSDRAAAAAACGSLLEELGKDVEVLVCTDPQLTLGVMDAVRENGRTNGLDIHLVGIGDDRQLPLLVRSGDLSGVLYPDPHAVASQVATLVTADTKALPLTLPQSVPLILVRGEAIEEYL